MPDIIGYPGGRIMSKNKNKIFCYDLETTGLIPHHHDIHQISGIIAIDWEIVNDFDFKVKPFNIDRCDQKALDIGGIEVEDFDFYMDQKECHNRLLMVLGEHCDKFDNSDKYIQAGYNAISFDSKFLPYFFNNCNDKYFGSWFNGTVLDPLPFLRTLSVAGVLPGLENHKLQTVCDYFGVSLVGAHDAKQDISATFEIVKIINKICAKLNIQDFISGDKQNIVERSESNAEEENCQEKERV